MSIERTKWERLPLRWFQKIFLSDSGEPIYKYHYKGFRIGY
jgi:hypothetical protein